MLGMGAKINRHTMTMIDLSTHLVLALMLALFFWWLTRTWQWPVLGFIGGVLIDLDHFVDYFRYYGLKFNVVDFFRQGYRLSEKRYVVFHSWEIIVLFWILSMPFSWFTPIAAGMTVHLLTDYIFHHRPNAKFFSLVYRIRHDFKVTEK